MGKKLEKLKSKITNFDMESLTQVFGKNLGIDLTLHKVHDFNGFLVLIGKSDKDEYHFFSLHDNFVNYDYGKDEHTYFVGGKIIQGTKEQKNILNGIYKKFLIIKFGLKAVKDFKEMEM